MAGSCDLPDLSAVVPGLERRRRRRPRRHHRAAALRRRPRRRRDLAVADLPLADGRHGLRRRRLYRHRPGLRLARRLRRDGRARPRPRAQGPHRPGALAFVERAPVLQGEPAEPRQSEGRLVRLGRPQARRLAAEQLARGVRRLAPGSGRAGGGSTICTTSWPSSRTSTSTTRGAGLAALDNALLARPRRRRLPARHRQLLLSRRAAAGRPGRLPPQGEARGQPLLHAVPHLLEEPAGEPRLPRADAQAARRLRGPGAGGRDGREPPRDPHDGRIHHRQAPAQSLLVRDARRPLRRRRTSAARSRSSTPAPPAAGRPGPSRTTTSAATSPAGRSTASAASRSPSSPGRCSCRSRARSASTRARSSARPRPTSSTTS